jgi:hypothetical protein
MSRNYNADPENDGDGSDVYDGSRDSANDIIDNNYIVVSTTKQQEINPNIIEEGQGTISGAITAVTAVTSTVSGNKTANTHVSTPPAIYLQQTRSETIQYARDIYMSGANWF